MKPLLLASVLLSILLHLLIGWGGAFLGEAFTFKGHETITVEIDALGALPKPAGPPGAPPESQNSGAPPESQKNEAPPESLNSGAPPVTPSASSVGPSASSTIGGPTAPESPTVWEASEVGASKVQYPRLSRILGEEGYVIISIGVSASGQPVFKVSQSSGFERLDDAARAAAERFFKIDFQNSDFSQDLRGAMQSPSGLKLKYTFRLKGEVKNGP